MWNHSYTIGVAAYFCEAFLKNEAVLLNSTVSHFFYVPAYIRAAIEQGTIIEFGYERYKYQDIFLGFVQLLEDSSNDSYVGAKELFSASLKIVKRFDSKLKKETPSLMDLATDEWYLSLNSDKLPPLNHYTSMSWVDGL